MGYIWIIFLFVNVFFIVLGLYFRHKRKKLENQPKVINIVYIDEKYMVWIDETELYNQIHDLYN